MSIKQGNFGVEFRLNFLSLIDILRQHLACFAQYYFLTSNLLYIHIGTEPLLSFVDLCRLLLTLFIGVFLVRLFFLLDLIHLNVEVEVQAM